MTDTSSAGSRRRTSTGWWLAAVLLLLVGAGSLTLGLRGQRHPLAGPVPQFAPPPTTPQASPLPTWMLLPVASRSTPVSLHIPAIGLSVSLSTLGLNPNGTVQVPTDIQQPGWFRLGPSPGQMGSAVILGHVDSYQGPAVFFQLRALHTGDQVEVSLADGVLAHFAVKTVDMYSKAHFPDNQIYGYHGYSSLQLVTCGGTFDPTTGHYLSNIVVYTSLVSLTAPPRPAAPKVSSKALHRSSVR